jgi:nucleotide-binding universal stress UspA family protein
MSPRIVVPMDFSPAADAALEEAILLGIPLQATIDLVHVQEPAPDEKLEGCTLATSEAMTEHVHDALTRRARRVTAAGLHCEAHALRGAPAPVILRHAHGDSVALIVMGARGRSTTIPTRLGAVASDVTRGAEVPVVVVPASQPPVQVGVHP